MRVQRHSRSDTRQLSERPPEGSDHLPDRLVQDERDRVGDRAGALHALPDDACSLPDLQPASAHEQALTHDFLQELKGALNSELSELDNIYYLF